MTPSEMEFLMATLETNKKTYRYFKDKYALDLLAWQLKVEVSVSSLKKSEWGFLTQKDAVKQRLAKAGSKKISSRNFADVYHPEDIYFNYTIGQWGEYFKRYKDEWYQTSRSGKNLVLQLNFDESHNINYYKWVRPKNDNHPFTDHGHPICEKGALTMAWARLDIDLENGDVLIEEIQSDWLRYAKSEMRLAKRRLEEAEQKPKEGLNVPLAKFRNTCLIRYFEECLKKYVAIWEEAVLNLAIQFSISELGCEKVYYNTFDTGNIMKELSAEYTRPPKSLYTKLPKKFGFKITREPPKMLKEEKLLRKRLKTKGLEWFVLG